MGERLIVVVDDDCDTLEYMEALLGADGARVSAWGREAGAYDLRHHLTTNRLTSILSPA